MKKTDSRKNLYCKADEGESAKNVKSVVWAKQEALVDERLLFCPDRELT
jgi:hypothetical protein